MDSSKLAYLRRIRAQQIDGRIDSPAYDGFVAYLDATHADNEHYLRYCRTFAAMTERLPGFAGQRVLETGDLSPITRYLATLGAECRTTTTDLRYAIDADTATIDTVLSLEVIEHLKDQTETKFSEIVLFRGTGMRQYAEEVLRVLRPGGHVVVTTPNPASMLAITRLIDYEAPCIYRPHVREYVRSEILEIFAPLELVHYETHYSFFMLDEAEQAHWARRFESHSWPTADRGDDQFLVFRKPLAPQSDGAQRAG